MTLSLILGVAGVAGQLLALRHPRAGWAIALANQPLWVALAITTGQYGLLLTCPGYATAAFLQLRRAHRAAKPTTPVPAREAATVTG